MNEHGLFNSPGLISLSQQYITRQAYRVHGASNQCSLDPRSNLLHTFLYTALEIRVMQTPEYFVSCMVRSELTIMVRGGGYPLDHFQILHGFALAGGVVPSQKTSWVEQSVRSSFLSRGLENVNKLLEPASRERICMRCTVHRKTLLARAFHSHFF